MDRKVEMFNTNDYTLIRNVASHFITQCRRARISENFKLFNAYANLLTGRTDLDFQNYEDAKTFSCTLEMERRLNKVFG